MNQKVVFLDVDGTIVNDKGIIPESAQIAIRKAVENGHKLVVCSGRSLFQLPQMLLDLGFSGMVTAAGAQVIADGKEIYHAVIDEEHRKFIVDYMEKNNFVYCFQTDAGVVMNKRSEQQILKIMSDMGITEEHLRQLVGEFFIQEDVWNNEKEEKLIYYDAPFGVARVHADLEPYFDVVALSLSGADDYCGEVGINGIHKATDEALSGMCGDSQRGQYRNRRRTKRPADDGLCRNRHCDGKCKGRSQKESRHGNITY